MKASKPYLHLRKTDEYELRYVLKLPVGYNLNADRTNIFVVDNTRVITLFLKPDSSVDFSKTPLSGMFTGESVGSVRDIEINKFESKISVFLFNDDATAAELGKGSIYYEDADDDSSGGDN